MLLRQRFFLLNYGFRLVKMNIFLLRLKSIIKGMILGGNALESGPMGINHGVREKFIEWAKNKVAFLKVKSISTEFVKYEKGEDEIPDPNTAVIYESKSYMGQVIVWKSRQMEYELLKRDDPNKFAIWKYIEKVEEDPNFDLILYDFLKMLNE